MSEQKPITINVKRATERAEKGEPVRVHIEFSFYPESIGEEREQRIYRGLGEMLSGAMEDSEAQDFIEQFREQGRKQGAAPKVADLSEFERELQEQPEPVAKTPAFPLRMVI